MSEIDAARLRANIEKGFLPNRGEALALLDALEKARPAPSQSDEEAWEPIRQAILTGGTSFHLFVKARAEATLAGAAAERGRAIHDIEHLQRMLTIVRAENAQLAAAIRARK